MPVVHGRGLVLAAGQRLKHREGARQVAKLALRHAEEQDRERVTRRAGDERVIL